MATRDEEQLAARKWLANHLEGLGTECPECGKMRPKPTQWDHILSV
jgi:hypothetical protein